MSHEAAEAFQWWNSHVNENVIVTKSNSKSNISPPECIMPQKALIAWSNICPFFQYLNIDQTDIQKYWESIQKIVSLFYPNEKIPNPISNFPDFIIKLYLIRDVLFPKTVPMCLKFINANMSENKLHEEKNINKQISNTAHNKANGKNKNRNSNQAPPNQTISLIDCNNCFGNNPASFCIYNLPLYFLDPVLYFQTLLTLRSSNHPFWQNAISNTKVVDAFFEMQTNFILPLPAFSANEFWEHRLYLSDILFHLIEHIFIGNNATSILKSHPKAFQFTIKFVECCIKLAKNASFGISVVFFRYIIRILKIAQNKIPNDQIKTLSLQFLLNLDKSNSSLVPLAVSFLLKMKPLVIPHSRIIRMISKRGIRDLSDIEIIPSLCEGNNILQILTLLCRSAISNKLWHRACMSEIIGIINRFSERIDVKDWFQIFIRRIFIFISIASSKMRYRTRTLLLVESLASMSITRISWLQQAILIGAASIWSTKIVPPYFKNFFPLLSSPDDLTIHELESFANSDIILKSFPFDAYKGTLILLPIIDIHKNPKTSLAQRTTKRTLNKANSNNTSFIYPKYGCPSASSASIPLGLNHHKTSSRSDKFTGRSGASKATKKTGSQKKRPEPLIKKPSGNKQSRPLASALCVSPLHRR